MSRLQLCMLRGYLKEFPMTDKTDEEIVAYMEGLRERYPEDYKVKECMMK